MDTKLKKIGFAVLVAVMPYYYSCAMVVTQTKLGTFERQQSPEQIMKEAQELRSHSLDLAAQKIKPLAESGNPKAEALLGWIYVDSGVTGVRKAQPYPERMLELNKWYNLAEKWFKKADAQGDNNGTHGLGIVYLFRSDEAQQPAEKIRLLKEAIRWYKKGGSFHTAKGLLEDIARIEKGEQK